MKLKRLIDQLKTGLNMLLKNLTSLQELDLTKPSPSVIVLLDNMEKPNDACNRIAQILQNGHVQHETLERKMNAFSRVSPKFKQISDAFRKGGGVPNKLFMDILLLYVKVITELLAATENIVVEDKIRDNV